MSAVPLLGTAGIDISLARLKMSAHRFAIGQPVRLKTRFGLPKYAPETYRITGTLPERDNSPQYRVRNENEVHERVMTEDDLVEMDPATKSTSHPTLARPLPN